MNRFTYQLIKELAESDSPGWWLGFLDNGNLVASRVVEVSSANAVHAAAWWESLPDRYRSYWMRCAGSTEPERAFRAARHAQAYADARQLGSAWLDRKARAS